VSDSTATNLANPVLFFSADSNLGFCFFTKIAAILYHANYQRADDLLKSVFLEMFGDPVRNEQGWDKPELKQFGKISTGNTPPRKDPSNYSSQHIEWIKTDNISADSVFISQAAEYLSETGATKARTVGRSYGGLYSWKR
jgi:type I restriction enzyme S subunit